MINNILPPNTNPFNIPAQPNGNPPQMFAQPQLPPQGLNQGLNQVLPLNGQPILQNALTQTNAGSLVGALQNIPSPDTKTQLGVIASNPIANIAQVPSVFSKLTKDVEKQLLVTVLERFKTISELFKQPASDAVNALLKKELDALTQNFNDPSLRPIVDKLSRAAEIPIQRFLDNLTGILQRYFPALVGKLFNTAGNVVGEIPVVGLFVNAALAVSNVLNTVRTTSDIVDRTTGQFQSLQDELSNAINNLVDDTQSHVANVIDEGSTLGTVTKKTNHLGNSNHINHIGKGFVGGSAKRRRKMHTLKRIHHSIKQFIHTNKHTRAYTRKRGD